MIGRAKSPSVAELAAWIEEERAVARHNYASSAATGDNERAAFMARRNGYLEAAAEVVQWFQSDTEDAA